MLIFYTPPNHPSPSSIAPIKLQLTLSAVPGMVNLDVVSQRLLRGSQSRTYPYRAVKNNRVQICLESDDMQLNLNASVASPLCCSF